MSKTRQAARARNRQQAARRPMTDSKPVVVGQTTDSLANAMSGSGTSVDKRMHARWVRADTFNDQDQISNAYRGSWLMRRIVNTPAFDMTRAWRDWQGKDDQITKLEDEEKRLHVREKILQAVILGRLGGGALIIGCKAGLSATELPETINEGDLQYLHPVSRYALDVGELIDDPDNADFGQPEFYKLKRKGGLEPLPIHHTRVIVFKGEFVGLTGQAGADKADFWGDSIVQICDEPVKNATSTMNEFAAMVQEAKIDVFGIPDLLSQIGTPEYERRLMRRLELANLGKSTHRALVRDAAETWEQRQLNLSGMPDLIRTQLSVVAGAADIPATRLLGKSADGMNATGEGDQSNYDQMIRSLQDTTLRPALEKLDRVLVPSAGVKADDVYFEFAPLSVPTEAQMAETEGKEADTLNKLSATGLFQDEALEEAFSNRMIESGRWPGYEAARKKALAEAEKEPDPVDVTGLGLTQPPQPPLPGQAPLPTQPGNGGGGQPPQPPQPRQK